MSESILICIAIALELIILVAQMIIFLLHANLFREKESQYYTDYKYKGTILRVFKPEFEYEAIGNLPLNSLIDRGNMSPFYSWALIQIR